MKIPQVILEAVTYRIIAFIIGTAVLIAFTGPLLMAPIAIASAELVSTCWYCLHSKLWRHWRRRYWRHWRQR